MMAIMMALLPIPILFSIALWLFRKSLGIQYNAVRVYERIKLMAKESNQYMDPFLSWGRRMMPCIVTWGFWVVLAFYYFFMFKVLYFWHWVLGTSRKFSTTIHFPNPPIDIAWQQYVCLYFVAGGLIVFVVGPIFDQIRTNAYQAIS